MLRCTTYGDRYTSEVSWRDIAQANLVDIKPTLVLIDCLQYVKKTQPVFIQTSALCGNKHQRQMVQTSLYLAFYFLFIQ